MASSSQGILIALLALTVCLPPRAFSATDSTANRLRYLDEFCDPYYPSKDFPKLTTPQWIGEDGVEAVVILAIDDMRQYAAYEVYLRPILERLKQIDGRAPVSIMSCAIDREEPQLQTWLKEGVTLEIHTTTHPCPLLAGGDLAKAKSDYDRCVDHFFTVAGNHPVAFRTPCMDGINSTGPRLYAGIMLQTTAQGHFLALSSSVAHLFTPEDANLPRELVLDAEGKPRFSKYLLKGFVNFIENYPYPYVIGGGIWELPFSVPDDYEGHARHGSKNPVTLADMQAALDLVVRRQGIYVKCFHPYAWLANTQIVAFVEHAIRHHGRKVKFLNFREAEERLSRHLLAGQPLRAPNGQPNGVRLLDLNNDGYLDVVIGNESLRQTRIWDSPARRWQRTDFPTRLVQADGEGNRCDTGARFGIVAGEGYPILMVRNDQENGAWRFDGAQWISEPSLLSGLELEGKPVLTAQRRAGFQPAPGSRDDRDARGSRLLGQAGSLSHLCDRGVRLCDIDHDGVCEIVVANESQSAVFVRHAADRTWKRRAFGLPAGAAIVDERGQDNGLRFVDLNRDGYEDVVFSNQDAFSVDLYVPTLTLGFHPGWTRQIIKGKRGQSPELPMISRGGEHPNNGAWFTQGEMRVQNEDTAQQPDLILRHSFADLLSGFQPPAQSPTQSLSTLQAPPRFTVELVAQEPMVQSPVFFEWSGDGRLWVVEMCDYPLGIPSTPTAAAEDGRASRGGRVVVLEDTNDDGRYDKSSVFLENLNFPTGLALWRQGILVSAAPDILYAEDTDADGKADRVEKLFTGFREGNQQHRVNGFAYGLDTWIYGANGDSGGAIVLADGFRRLDPAHASNLTPQAGQNRATLGPKPVSISGRDFRFRPETGEFETAAGHTQYGRVRDDWGNWFGNANPIWLWHYYMPEHYLKRNPFLAVERVSREVADYPDAKRVFPVGRKQQRWNDIGMAGHVTSACGAAPYRDELFGEDFARAVFISEPVHNLIRCEILQPDGISFTSHRWPTDEPREFLASTDPWFRPITIRTGPDGALYFADMYRQYIEHPEWIPEDAKKRADLRAGEGMGRIYRVYPAGKILRKTPRLDRLSAAELAQALDHPNGWQRDTAQRLLIWRGDRHAIEPLRTLVAASANAKARLSALGALDGLGAITPNDLILALQDPHPAVREHAIRLCEPFLKVGQASSLSLGYSPSNLSPKASAPAQPSVSTTANDPGTGWRPVLLSALLARADDPEVRVRYQLAFTLGEWNDPRATDGLAKLALRDAARPDVILAVASSSATRPAEIFAALLAAKIDLAPLDRLIRTLVSLIAAENDRHNISTLVAQLLTTSGQGDRPAPWQIGAFAQLWRELERLNRTFEPAGQAALPKLCATARLLAADVALPVDQRVTALALLGREPGMEAEDIAQLAALLQPQNPDALVRAALSRLGQIGSEAVPAAVLKGWKSYAPAARALAMEALLRRETWLARLLDGIETKAIAVEDLSPSARQRLLAFRNDALPERAKRLLSRPVNVQRQKIIDDYLPDVRKATGHAGRGSELFVQQCAVCHRLAYLGTAAGPDLATVPDRSIERMLVAILDPNRAVEDKYVNYVARMKNGDEHSGFVAAETANSITLVSASGASQMILRRDLEALLSTGASLMPEGFEEFFKPQDLADLLAFIEASAAPPKSFSGNRPTLVRPDGNGALRLRSANAEIYGESIQFEAKYKNLGMWSGANDRAVWTVEVPTGAYDVWLHWACQDATAGNRFRLQLGQTVFIDKVPGTGTWDQYRAAKFGRIEIEAGRHRALFQAEPPQRNALIDLLEVRLVPADSPGQPEFDRVGER